MAIATLAPRYFLGAYLLNVKVLAPKVDEIINMVNGLIAGTSSFSVVKTNTISPITVGGPIAITSTLIQRHTASTINATATATASQIMSGVVTSTSVAPTSITLPTAASLVALGGTPQSFTDFIVDNSAGASVVTVVPSASILVVAIPVITGSGTLTVANLTVGHFRIYFTNTTSAIIYRLA